MIKKIIIVINEKEIVMSLEDAKRLYGELGELFGVENQPTNDGLSKILPRIPDSKTPYAPPYEWSCTIDNDTITNVS